MSKAFQTIVSIAAFAVMLAGLPSNGLAGRVNIDDFSGVQAVRDPVLIFPTNNYLEQGGAIGGFRGMEAKNTTASGGALTMQTTTNDRLFFDLGTSASSGTGTLTYKGEDEAGMKGSGGVDGVNLLPGSASAAFFAVDIVSIDQVQPLPEANQIVFTIKLKDADGEVGEATGNAAVEGVFKLPFSSFDTFGSLNFTRITEITLEMSAIDGLDFTLDSFYTAVPEPSTMVLFGLGLAAFYGTSRWRKRNTKSNA